MEGRGRNEKVDYRQTGKAAGNNYISLRQNSIGAGVELKLSLRPRRAMADRVPEDRSKEWHL